MKPGFKFQQGAPLQKSLQCFVLCVDKCDDFYYIFPEEIFMFACQPAWVMGAFSFAAQITCQPNKMWCISCLL